MGNSRLPLIKIPSIPSFLNFYTKIHTLKLKLFFYFKLSYSKFERDLQNTQPRPKHQKS